MSDDELAEDDGYDVGGRALPGSIRDFKHRCYLAIQREQEKPLPDNALIDVLCDAIRFAREHTDMVARRVGR